MRRKKKRNPLTPFEKWGITEAVIPADAGIDLQSITHFEEKKISPQRRGDAKISLEV